MNDDLLGCWAVNRVVSARIEPSVHTCSGLARNTPFVAKRGETSLARTFTAAYKVWNATTGGVKKTRRRGARVFQVFFFFIPFVWARLFKVSARVCQSVRQHPNSISTTKNMDNVTNTSSKRLPRCMKNLHLSLELLLSFFTRLLPPLLLSTMKREWGDCARESLLHYPHSWNSLCFSPRLFFPPQHLQEMSFLSSFASRHVLEALYTN